MSNAIELAFVVFGLFALLWAITAPSAHPAARVGAGAFGLLALLVAVLLRSDDDSHRREW